MIFLTKRLLVRKPKLTSQDIAFYERLWNAPSVMRNVGFPKGLQVNREVVQDILIGQDASPFDQTLVVETRDTHTRIGECKLGRPCGDGISITDVKLLPEHWNKGYGKEIKCALCAYLFSQTSCTIVEASPAITNIASIKMQEYCTGIKVRDDIYSFPTYVRLETQNVHSVVYHIHKESWMERFSQDNSIALIPVISKITDPAEKQATCAKILHQLPAWFGIESATEEYISHCTDTLFYALQLNGEMVGFYAITRHFPAVAEIYVCGIIPRFHRIGLGSMLQNHVEQELRKNKTKYITVKTLSPRHPSEEYARTREFYLACGFEPLEEFPTLWGESNPCLMLIKRLVWS